MTHFALLVITDREPTGELLEATLQPWNLNRWTEAGERPELGGKWDFWTVGGRFTGQMMPGYDPATDERNREPCVRCAGTGHNPDDVAETRCKRCGRTGRALKFESRWVDVGNRSRRRDLPLDAIRAAEEANYLAAYARRQVIVAGRPIPDIDPELKGDERKATDDAFWADPVVVDHRADDHWIRWAEIQDLRGGPEIAAKRGRLGGLITYAYLKDGVWRERDESAWRDTLLDEVNRLAWERDFATMLDELDPDVWLTVVDCHW